MKWNRVAVSQQLSSVTFRSAALHTLYHKMAPLKGKKAWRKNISTAQVCLAQCLQQLVWSAWVLRRMRLERLSEAKWLTKSVHSNSGSTLRVICIFQEEEVLAQESHQERRGPVVETLKDEQLFFMDTVGNQTHSGEGLEMQNWGFTRGSSNMNVGGLLKHSVGMCSTEVSRHPFVALPPSPAPLHLELAQPST